ncbi:sensor histidine kinase [Anthocerotibacter panamensis]|uniref:sensor histidine kinase n=1 Tax=Anthocerotibacter panamensis TaxID=2857077 RepID=UPI001C4052E6|nr:ATP-binding protein [Anthocerotibacter panamensis]
MSTRIRQSLELDEILAATALELRNFLRTDRIKVYRFHPDGHGEVVAEARTGERLPSLMGLHFPEEDIPAFIRERYLKSHTRTIVNVASGMITLNSPPVGVMVGRQWLQERPSDDLFQHEVDPCHIEYLTNMGIMSSLVVPVLHHQELWGLLISHHSETRLISREDLYIVQNLADQVSLAIAQASLLDQARKLAQREAFINRIVSLLHAPRGSDDLIDTALTWTIEVLHGNGGRLFLYPLDWKSAPRLYAQGQQPVQLEVGLLEELPLWREAMALPSSPMPLCAADYPTMQVVTDLYANSEWQALTPYFQETPIRGFLVLPLCFGQEMLGCLTVFRGPTDTETFWAGYHNPDERQAFPRRSFTQWQHFRRNQAQPWTEEEVTLLKALGGHLSMAVMQNRLYQCEREQRLLLEMRNQALTSARVAAEEASRLKSDFLASTSHELRTPLASTLNYLKLLKEGFYDNEAELKEFIDGAYQSTVNLVSIINDVLDIAKIEAGHLVLNLESVDLPALLEEQNTLFTPESRRYGVSLTIDCAIKHVWADQTKLRQVLTNLLANAFKFTDHGQVQVQAVLSDSMAEISISDTGIGIEMSDPNVLFEPFVQASGSTERHYGGTGLGLTICKFLVERMGGQIWLYSLGKNQGTTVTFTLPLTQPNQE